MSGEKVIGQSTSFEFVVPTDNSPGPVTLEEFDALIKKIAERRDHYDRTRTEVPNVLILSNRQWHALAAWEPICDVRPDIKEPNFRGMNIIVDARGDYPNTPLVGHIEF